MNGFSVPPSNRTSRYTRIGCSSVRDRDPLGCRKRGDRSFLACDRWGGSGWSCPVRRGDHWILWSDLWPTHIIHISPVYVIV